MPKYTVEAPDGRKFDLEGDSPPTEQELEHIFSSMGGDSKAEEASTPSEDIVNRLKGNLQVENLLGGKPLDPETGKPAYTQEGDDLKQVQMDINRRRLERENNSLQDKELSANASPVTSAMVGAASVPVGIAQLGEMGIKKILGDAMYQRTFANQDRIDQEMRDRMEREAGANPVSAGAGAALLNAASMGGVGGTIRKALAGEFGEAGKEYAKNVLVNMAVNSGVRKVTGQETNAKDLGLDALLAAIGGRKSPELIEEPIPKGAAAPAQPTAAASAQAPSEPQASPQASSASSVNLQPPKNYVPGVGFVKQTADDFLTNLPFAGKAFQRRNANNARLTENKAMDQAASEEIANNIPSISPFRAKQVALDAMDAGIDRGALKAIASATPEEKDVASRMASDAKAHSLDDTQPDPSLHVGNEIKTRIEDGEQVVENLGRDIDRTVRKMNPESIGDARQLAFERMQKNPMFRGIKMDGEGNLIFERTRLNGPGNASARADVQRNFDHLTGKDPEELHNFRQSLADQIDLAKKSNTPLSDAHDIALNSIRQGAMDALGPDYAMLEEMQAKVVRPLKAIRNSYRGLEGASEDILKEKGALLGRRLTSNAPSGPQLKANLEALENGILENGGKVNTSVAKLADFQNLLDELYGIRKKGSLAGQVKLGTQHAIEGSMESGKMPTSIGEVAGVAADSVGRSFKRTDATRQAAFEKFMKTVEAKKPKK
jgi:hypothetical protein